MTTAGIQTGQRVRVSGWSDPGEIMELVRTRFDGLWVRVQLDSGQRLTTRARNVTIID